MKKWKSCKDAPIPLFDLFYVLKLDTCIRLMGYADEATILSYLTNQRLWRLSAHVSFRTCDYGVKGFWVVKCRIWCTSCLSCVQLNYKPSHYVPGNFGENVSMVYDWRTSSLLHWIGASWKLHVKGIYNPIPKVLLYWITCEIKVLVSVPCFMNELYHVFASLSPIHGGVHGCKGSVYRMWPRGRGYSLCQCHIG